jgi:hypothetical protein
MIVTMTTSQNWKKKPIVRWTCFSMHQNFSLNFTQPFSDQLSTHQQLVTPNQILKSFLNDKIKFPLNFNKPFVTNGKFFFCKFLKYVHWQGFLALISIKSWLSYAGWSIFLKVLLQMATLEAGIFLSLIPGCQCGYTAHVWSSIGG